MKALVAAGWRVYATALPGQDTTDLAGEDIEVVEVDLTDEQSTAELLKAVTREDRLDAFVSNAGIVAPGPVIEREMCPVSPNLAREHVADLGRITFR